LKKLELASVLKLIASMLRNKQQVADEGVIMLFELALAECEVDQVMKALKKILKEGVEFALEPHHIIDAMGASKAEIETRASEQWNEFALMVRAYPNPIFDDVVTAHIAQSVISIWDCKNKSEEAFEKVEKRFLTEYKKICADQSFVDEIISKAAYSKLLSNSAKRQLIESGRIESLEEANRRIPLILKSLSEQQ
jgi:hypothetical protein